MAVTLEQLVASGVRHAKHLLLKKREPQLAPFYTLITDQNELILLPCQWRNDADKEAAVAAVKATALLTHAVQAVYVAEAWLLKPKEPVPLDELRVRPSESPDRIEVVHIIATDGTRFKSASLQMVRDRPGGKLMSLIPMPELENGEDTNYMGRMIDGLIPPRKEC